MQRGAWAAGEWSPVHQSGEWALNTQWRGDWTERLTASPLGAGLGRASLWHLRQPLGPADQAQVLQSWPSGWLEQKDAVPTCLYLPAS